MELSGKVIAVLDLQTGQGKKGEWRKQQFVVEYKDGDYTKSACFLAFGKAVDHIPNEGDLVTVSFNVESREYNSRWYTDLNAWKIQVTGKEQSRVAYDSSQSNNTSDDLPF